MSIVLTSNLRHEINAPSSVTLPEELIVEVLSRLNINAPSSVTLPEELIVEVLSRLNVKSVTRLKCVSKCWNSIISDSFFAKMHVDNSSRISHIMLYSSHVLNTSISVSFNIFPISGFLENPSINILKEDSKYQLTKLCHREGLIGSCNGLVCVLNSSENGFYVWNPATTQPFSENVVSYPLPLRHEKIYYRFSFGYDNLSNKYKLVMFSLEEVRVFTIGDNVWKNIQCFPVYPYSSKIFIDRIGGDGVYVSNSLNWFALLDNHGYYNNQDLNVEQLAIISLDLGTETYTKFQFPRDIDEIPSLHPTVCKLMDSLCFHLYTKEDSLVIWRMAEFGVEKSWTKLLKLDYHSLPDCYRIILYLLPLHIFENGDLLAYVSDIGEAGELIRYNMRDKRVVGKSIFCKNIYLYHVIPYVESLVSTF
ncbi:unnamed protein product [Lathyrus sativus]|nr:unnamed protein product [Lathyrus sativus]